MLNGGGGADGSSGGVVSSPPGVGSVVLESRAAPTVGEGVEDGREPGDFGGDHLVFCRINVYLKMR